jgi:hypothetical protein
MGGSGKQPEKYFFAGMPESDRTGRQIGVSGSPAPTPGQAVQSGMTAGVLRLRVWHALPKQHRNEVCRQIRKRCEAFVSSLRVSRNERQSEIDKLVSEVVAHLLRAVSTRLEDR